MRWALLAILVLGLVGTGSELILLDHYQDPWQVAPLALIGLALLVVVAYGVTRSPSSIVALQVVMLLFLGAGLLGLWLHYRSNAEFALEMDPSLAGLALFKSSMSGAMPALAPGAIIQLGLIGLLYTYRHPRTRSDAGAGPSRTRSQEWDE